MKKGLVFGAMLLAFSVVLISARTVMAAAQNPGFEIGTYATDKNTILAWMFWGLKTHPIKFPYTVG